MKKKIRIKVANPAGNITIFVLDEVPRKDYEKVASQLLAMDYEADEVGFIKEKIDGVDGVLEMSGMDFVANASRAFGLLLYEEQGLQGEKTFALKVSGKDETVKVVVKGNYTQIPMSLPLSMNRVDKIPEGLENVLVKGTLVDFGGLYHLVVNGVEPSKENYELLKKYMLEKFNPPGVGIMFCDPDKHYLTPVVYIKDNDTDYWEGSCGSGTAAVAAALANMRPDGEYTFQINQPADYIKSTAKVKDGKLVYLSIEGPVEMKAVESVEIEC
ncbi:MAG: hypothetical protein MJ145_04675 [Clostridia bacterium]|nr:hypothetical protein [Clostridia bacterium]